jgi:hypothetical protein
MKYSLLAIATALIVTYSAESLAQSVEVEIAPESRTRIKEYVVRERVPSVRVRERITVGAVLPEEVELRTVPSDWGPWGTRYRYVYSDDNIYLVEPSSRRVVRVID